MQTLFGGSKSSSGPSGVTGFNALPADITNTFSNLAKSAGNTLNPSGNPSSPLTTLPTLNTGAQTAQSELAGQNFAITPQSIQDNIAEQLDPYKESVINQIEKAQNGSLSQLNSMLTNSNTFGSNRGILGASDISNTAADQIGQFLSGEYNTNLQNALTTIPQQNTASATGAVNSGLLTQQQQLQNQLAPATALQMLAQILGVVPSNTSVANQSSSSSSAGIL